MISSIASVASLSAPPPAAVPVPAAPSAPVDQVHISQLKAAREKANSMRSASLVLCGVSAAACLGIGLGVIPNGLLGWAAAGGVILGIVGTESAEAQMRRIDQELRK